MTSSLRHLVWLAIALLCGSVLAADPIRWAPDIAVARQMSAQYKVPLLVHFYGDGCLPCKTLEQRVLSQQEVAGALNKYFICVKVNGSTDPKTAAEFGVHSWPTDVFVSPDGKTLFQGVCPQDMREYVKILENVAFMNRDRNIMLAATQPTQPAATIAQQTAAVGDGRTMASQLPAPGANLATNSQTPSFYNNPQSLGQQLAPSMSPTAGVQSGPLLASEQPSGITGSTVMSQQQLSGPTAPDFNLATHGKLPPRAPQQSQIASPVNTTTAPGQMVGYQKNPAVRDTQLTLPQTAPQAAAVTMQSREQPTGEGQMVNNPYFNSPVAGSNRYALDATAQVSGTPIAPQTTAALPATPHVNTGPANSGLSVNQSASAPAPQIPLHTQPTHTPMAQNSAHAATKQAGQPTSVPAQAVSFQPRNQPDIAEANTVATQPTATSADANPASAPSESKSSPAVGGYCPVALAKSAQWVEGNPSYSVKHRGRVYWLSSAEAQHEFLSKPDVLSPVLSGYDPMVFLNEGRLVEGDIQFGLHEQIGGSLLFFSSEASKLQYEQNYDVNTRALRIIEQQIGVK